MGKNWSPCLDSPRGIVPEDAEPKLIELLSGQCDRMTQHIEFLTRNRDSMATHTGATNTALEARLQAESTQAPASSAA